MKKLILLILVMLLTVGLLAGCGQAKSEKVKTGLAVITAVDKSTHAGTQAGLAQIDATVVAVTVDNKGKIVKCVIDAVQSRINFDASGKIITPLATVFPSKNELAEGYGMKRASAIGKEWHEQAAAQAQELGATSADQLRLGIVTTMANSVNAGERLGLAEAYSTYVAITQNAKGTITSCVIDATQGRVNFDPSGRITTDLTARIKSKNELGDGYGMKRASTIGKEWHEQAAAFARYVPANPAVAGIAVDAGKRPVDRDLQATVTVGIGDFQAALAKAAGQ